MIPETITIQIDTLNLLGELVIPADCIGGVLFAHGSGSSRFSPRNRAVARVLNIAGIGTLLFDLLTTEEDMYPHARFDVAKLADRLAQVIRWFQNEYFPIKPLGIFGASTGSAAALIAASRLGSSIAAVVSRGGRPDLAGSVLGQVKAATMLIVGGNDTGVLTLNQGAFEQLVCKKRLEVVEGATHLFEEAGTLDKVAHLATEWFVECFTEINTREGVSLSL